MSNPETAPEASGKRTSKRCECSGNDHCAMNISHDYTPALVSR